MALLSRIMHTGSHILGLKAKKLLLARRRKRQGIERELCVSQIQRHRSHIRVL